MHPADSPCCMEETNATLQTNHTPVKQFKNRDKAGACKNPVEWMLHVTLAKHIGCPPAGALGPGSCCRCHTPPPRHLSGLTWSPGTRAVGRLCGTPQYSSASQLHHTGHRWRRGPTPSITASVWLSLLLRQDR